jgi:hypothetical protein
VQQAGPENRAGHRRQIAPIHTGGHSGSDDAARAGSGNEGRPDSRFRERFDYADVRKSAHAAAAESQHYLFGAK